MRKLARVVLGISVLAGSSLFAQPQSYYVGANVTGQLLLSGTVNLSQLARLQAQRLQAPGVAVDLASAKDAGDTVFAPESALALPFGRLVSDQEQDALRRFAPRRLRPPQRLSPLAALGALDALAVPSMHSLNVAPAGPSGFSGITHAQQRQANGGKQFSVEPPSQGLAVGNGFVVEGVNNAFQVYDASGAPLLPNVLSTNQVFGLPPAIDWNTGVNGVYPTDIRVFFDHGINRWFVLQRAQDYDSLGNPLDSSHLYLAVSKTGDPTGTYNIYTMVTTNASNFGCPCFADYPQIGADEYGFYISANEFNTSYSYFVDATIMAISKASLASGASSPTAYQFVIPFSTGYEFAIQPATTPPGASYFLANGGGEFFVSSQASYSFDSNLSLWAMTNTSSLLTTNPNLLLTRTLVPSLTYVFPDIAIQRPGPLPYGSSLSPPGVLAYLDGGDSRIQSLSYAGGRLYATFATQVTDENYRSLVGSAYVILSPSLRGGALAAPVLRQGYLMVKGNHILRPAIGVTPQGRGAIVFTLVGPDYYPSAVFLPIDTFSTASTVQIAGPGAGPEDGFSGYTDPGFPGVARWGDYSAAVAAADGTIWMATEYIPNAPRTESANWGTFLIRYIP